MPLHALYAMLLDAAREFCCPSRVVPRASGPGSAGVSIRFQRRVSCGALYQLLMHVTVLQNLLAHCTLSCECTARPPTPQYG